jgi:putative membrane protein
MRIRNQALILAAALGAASAVYADDDADFARKAASDGQLEVELGKYAAAHASDAEVKRFGRMMVDDHSQANQQLQDLAKKKGIQVEPKLSADQREKATELMRLKGADFDKAYVDAMVEDHEKAVDTFGKQANQNQSDIDHWAASTLPKLRDHLAHARELQQKESRADVSRNP